MHTAQIKLQMQMCNLRSQPGQSMDHQGLGKEREEMEAWGPGGSSEVNVQPQKPKTASQAPSLVFQIQTEETEKCLKAYPTESPEDFTPYAPLHPLGSVGEKVLPVWVLRTSDPATHAAPGQSTRH